MRILVCHIIVLISLFIVACSSNSLGKISTVKGSESLNGLWKLSKLPNKELEIRQVRLEVINNAYSLYAGCNQMKGTIVLNNNIASFRFMPGASTLMGCPDDYDQKISKLISASTAKNIKGRKLVFYDDRSSIIAVFNKVEKQNLLEGKEWSVQGLNINQAMVSRADQPKQTLNFDKGVISGDAGCNKYSGRYTVKDKNILYVSSINVTEKRCDKSIISYELRFLELLKQPLEIDQMGSGIWLRNQKGVGQLSIR